jgi:hypothetical protein
LQELPELQVQGGGLGQTKARHYVTSQRAGSLVCSRGVVLLAPAAMYCRDTRGFCLLTRTQPGRRKARLALMHERIRTASPTAGGVARLLVAPAASPLGNV